MIRLAADVVLLSSGLNIPVARPVVELCLCEGLFIFADVTLQSRDLRGSMLEVTMRLFCCSGVPKWRAAHCI